MKALAGRALGTRKSLQAKGRVGSVSVTFLWGLAGVYQADDLPNADQGIPEGLVQDSVLGRASAVIKLGPGLVTDGLA